MSIARKHAYRFGYLKSEQWKSIRVEALLRTRTFCQICACESFHNDAHHVWYPPSIWKTSSKDIAILCRRCHNIVHALLNSERDRNRAFSLFRRVASSLRRWFGVNKKGKFWDKKANKPKNKPKTLVVEINKIVPIKRVKLDRCRLCLIDNVPLVIIQIIPSNPKPHFEWPVCPICQEFILATPPKNPVEMREVKKILAAKMKVS